MEQFGQILEIKPARNVGTAKEFWVRDFSLVINHNDRYPQTILFQGIWDVVEDLNELRPGDYVTVEYSLRGRVKNEKYHNTLEVKKVSKN